MSQHTVMDITDMYYLVITKNHWHDSDLNLLKTAITLTKNSSSPQNCFISIVQDSIESLLGKLKVLKDIKFTRLLIWNYCRGLDNIFPSTTILG